MLFALRGIAIVGTWISSCMSAIAICHEQFPSCMTAIALTIIILLINGFAIAAIFLIIYYIAFNAAAVTIDCLIYFIAVFIRGIGYYSRINSYNSSSHRFAYRYILSSNTGAIGHYA